MTRLTAATVMQAYAMGVFPMAMDRASPTIHWIDPERRGIFPLDGFHISRRLRRTLLHDPYQIHLNRDFAATMTACADRPETWINDQIFAAYSDLHRRGHAHSLEVWQDGQMVGGVYGVTLGAAFFGESMFSRRRDGSKIALAWLIARLRHGGFTLFDTQFLTPHLASLGAIEISRARFQAQLRAARRGIADIAALPPDTPAQQVFGPLP